MHGRWPLAAGRPDAASAAAAWAGWAASRRHAATCTAVQSAAAWPQHTLPCCLTVCFTSRFQLCASRGRCSLQSILPQYFCSGTVAAGRCSIRCRLGRRCGWPPLTNIRVVQKHQNTVQNFFNKRHLNTSVRGCLVYLLECVLANAFYFFSAREVPRTGTGKWVRSAVKREARSVLSTQPCRTHTRTYKPPHAQPVHGVMFVACADEGVTDLGVTLVPSFMLAPLDPFWGARSVVHRKIGLLRALNGRARGVHLLVCLYVFLLFFCWWRRCYRVLCRSVNLACTACVVQRFASSQPLP